MHKSDRKRKLGTGLRQLRIETLESRELLSATDGSVASESNFANSYPETPTVIARQVEDLNRGVVVVRQSNSAAYIGWRMLGTDSTDVTFDLYRSENGAAPIKLNWQDPIIDSTNYVDSSANLNADNTYFVKAHVNGIEQDTSESFTLAASSPVQQFLSVPLQPPADGITPIGDDYSYDANDISVGDLNGDGQYELIMKWEPTNKKDNSHSGYTGNTYIDAYTIEGQLLWRIDLGVNIRSGPHYTQFLVYDFDGDGLSEVAMKTAPGTVDGQGNNVILPGDSPTDDYRNSWGTIFYGSEYFTVFDGLTGAELQTIEFPLERGDLNSWGDNYGNRSERYLATVAYLDGSRPSIVWARGYYGPSSGYTARNEVVALDWRDGQLTQRWRFNASTEDPATEDYIAQGSNALFAADVDGDGFDEIIHGAAVLDHDGTGLYSTGLGHGDALYISDMDPSRPGLEIYMVHESASQYGDYGAEMHDAMTGEILVGIPSTGDVGRGVAADVDPSSPGYEMWGVVGGGNEYTYSTDGQQLDPIAWQDYSVFYNMTIWWDDDLTRELVDAGQISNWNNPGRTVFDLDPATSGTQHFAANASSNNGSKKSPSLVADILGDWREEVIWRRSDNTELFIYTTIIPSTDRIYTLMHDTLYRTSIASQNVAYNQPANPSFFLGAGMADPPTPVIYFGGELAGDYNSDDIVNAADYTVWRDNLNSTTSLEADGNHDGIVDADDYTVWVNNYSAVASASVALASLTTVSATEAYSVVADSNEVDSAATVANAQVSPTTVVVDEQMSLFDLISAEEVEAETASSVVAVLNVADDNANTEETNLGVVYVALAEERFLLQANNGSLSRLIELEHGLVGFAPEADLLLQPLRIDNEQEIGAADQSDLAYLFEIEDSLADSNTQSLKSYAEVYDQALESYFG